MTPTPQRCPVRGQRAGALLLGLVLALTAVGGAVAAGDPYRPQQWNLDRIGASAVWPSGSGAGQVIAVVDSGVDLGHPDLVDKFVRDDRGTILGLDVVEGDAEPQDPLGHGTMVAGIAVAATANDEGIAAVAPDASLLPVRVLDEKGRGTRKAVDRGIRWAVDHGATVINLSLESASGGDADGPDGKAVAAPVAAVDYAWANGVVVVAAAGNSGNGFTDYPRTSPVVLVGATDREDRRAEFSDSGRDDLLMAPGVEIVSTWCREAGRATCPPELHSYGIADGTSFAAPHVAGAVAVLRSAGLDHRQAVQTLRRTARDLETPGRDDRTGFGLVDLVAAMEQVEPAPAPSEPPSPEPGNTAAAPSPGPSTAPPPATEPAEPTPPPTPTQEPLPMGDGEVTTPRVDAQPVVAPEPRSPARGPLSALAAVLVVVAGMAVGREWGQRTR